MWRSRRKVAGSHPDSARLTTGMQGWLDVRPSVNARHLFNRSALSTHRGGGQGELTSGRGAVGLKQHASWRPRTGGRRSEIHEWEPLHPPRSWGTGTSLHCPGCSQRAGASAARPGPLKGSEPHPRHLGRWAHTLLSSQCPSLFLRLCWGQCTSLVICLVLS